MMNIRLFFSELKDHRQGMKVQHDLLEIIAMTLIAIAADCDGWDEIEDFCQQYEEWLKGVVGLTLQGGVPTADIFQKYFLSHAMKMPNLGIGMRRLVWYNELWAFARLFE